MGNIGVNRLEGIYFYWFAWIGWVILTFFSKKTSKRTFFAFVILLMLTFSTRIISVGVIEFNVTFFIGLFTSYVILSKVSFIRQLYFTLASLTITIAYVSFHLFELFDPVWLVFERQWMLGIIMAYLTLMLVKEPLLRMAVVFSGIGQGDILYTIILGNFSFPHTIGSLQMLDGLAITLMLLFLWYLFENIAVYFDQAFPKKSKERQG